MPIGVEHSPVPVGGASVYRVWFLPVMPIGVEHTVLIDPELHERLVLTLFRHSGVKP